MPAPIDRLDLDAGSVEGREEVAGPRRGRIAAGPSKFRRGEMRGLTVLMVGDANHHARLIALLQRVEHRRRGRADQAEIIDCDVDRELGAGYELGKPPRHLLRLRLLLVAIVSDQEHTLDRSLLPL